MPAMMPSPGPSNHLILTKHPVHTEEQISWRCLVDGSVQMHTKGIIDAEEGVSELEFDF